jgi:CHAT domain-containing protein/tetratricopeptide (TPR) repeat protein
MFQHGRRWLALAGLGALLLCASARDPVAAPGAGGAAAEARAALTAADRFLATGDRRRGRAAYERALACARTAGARRLMAHALGGLGDTANPHQPEMLAFYRQSAELSAGRDRDLARARVLFASAVQDVDRGALPRARERFTEALTLATVSGDRPLLARLHRALGNVALLQGDLRQAEESYTAGLRLLAGSADRWALSQAHKTLGDLYASRDENGAALEEYEAGLAAVRGLGDRNAEAGLLNAVGTVHLAWADYARAQRYFQGALDRAPTDPSLVAYALNNSGIVFGLTGQEDLSRERFERALALLEQAGNTSEAARLLNNLGESYAGRGEHERALAAFRRAIARAEESGDTEAIPGHWKNIGDTRAAQGRRAEARAAYRKSLELAEKRADRSTTALALLGLARLHSSAAEPGPALPLADRAAALAVETGERETFWQARTLAGEALEALHREGAAGEAFAQAVTTLEQLRGQAAGGAFGRQGFLASRLAPYRDMVALLARRGDAAGALAALSYAERAKARALLDLRSAGRGAARPELTAAERAREAELRERLAALNQQLFLERRRTGQDHPARLEETGARLRRAQLDLDSFRSDLYASRPQLQVRRADLSGWAPGPAGALSASAPTTFLEYVVTEEQTFLWTLTPATPADPAPRWRLHPIALRRPDLARAVEDFRRRLGDRNLAVAGAARRLYALLLAPAEAELKGTSALSIVPDGVLWNLPFQALETPGGEPLLARHALSYAPSLSLLAELARPCPAAREAGTPGPLFALGNPDLPEAAEEAREVGRLYGPGSRVLVGAAASEAAVKREAGRRRVLHFATHGVFDDRRPLSSHLVLARDPGPREGGEGGEDGLLEAWELLGLDLDADLVVLSACQTARGRLGEGEGVIGLTWALFAAGARAVVASAWQVDSAATRALMVDFHRRRLAGASNAEALRQAALAVREREGWRHPFYWAGFELLGNGSFEAVKKSSRAAQLQGAGGPGNRSIHGSM